MVTVKLGVDDPPHAQADALPYMHWVELINMVLDFWGPPRCSPKWHSWGKSGHFVVGHLNSKNPRLAECGGISIWSSHIDLWSSWHMPSSGRSRVWGVWEGLGGQGVGLMDYLEVNGYWREDQAF